MSSDGAGMHLQGGPERSANARVVGVADRRAMSTAGHGGPGGLLAIDQVFITLIEATLSDRLLGVADNRPDTLRAISR